MFDFISAPKDGTFIHLHLLDGTIREARWVKPTFTLFRNPDEEDWITPQGKFAVVPFNPAIGWSSL